MRKQKVREVWELDSDYEVNPLQTVGYSQSFSPVEWQPVREQQEIDVNELARICLGKILGTTMSDVRVIERPFPDVALVFFLPMVFDTACATYGQEKGLFHLSGFENVEQPMEARVNG